MARDTLTGTRIRERRSMKAMRQADLAREVGISASYLNLIEHNRRRIGGKLLLDIAGALGVEPSLLSEGAEAALVASLREAAVASGVPAVESDRADEFAGRFPGWAEVLAGAHRRVASLERTVETLSDRLTHDPQLAASVHEVLSTAASIRSTASILAEQDDIEPAWRDRFHKNLNQDSARLSQSSKALVNYLDNSETGQERRGVPKDEVEAFVASYDYHFPLLETGEATVADIVEGASDLTSAAARHIATGLLTRYRADCTRMPLQPFQEAVDQIGPDPVALEERFRVGLPAVFRRLATLPGASDTGLIVVDAAGSILFRKPIEGFATPRFGAGCPLWPLYTVLSTPQRPVRRHLVQEGRSKSVFDCYAISYPMDAPRFDADQRFHSAMLILRSAPEAAETAVPVGANCRVCARSDCVARREPSILSEGF